MFALDLIHTVAFAGAVLFIGYGIRDFMPPLSRYNIPAPVIGGLLVALAAWIARGQGVTILSFDTVLQTPLMIAFFTSVGFGASLSLLRVGGPQVLLLFAISSVFAIVQNLVGMAIAWPFGLDPLFGLDHLLAMVGIGIWAAQAGGRARWLVSATFVGVMAFAAALGQRGAALPAVEPMIAASDSDSSFAGWLKNLRLAASMP